jgi:hypothetical protein
MVFVVITMCTVQNLFPNSPETSQQFYYSTMWYPKGLFRATPAMKAQSLTLIIYQITNFMEHAPSLVCEELVRNYRESRCGILHNGKLLYFLDLVIFSPICRVKEFL